MLRTFGKKKPKVAKTAFIHDSAEVIGGVTLGDKASVWPFCVLRADVDNITIGPRTNIQDLTVIHVREGRPAIVGAGCTVGHRVILHGCRIGDHCLIGMGAVVMEAVIGSGCLVAAGSVVLAGFRAPPHSLIVGAPAKVARKLTPRERKMIATGESSYVRLARRHAETSRAVFGR